MVGAAEDKAQTSNPMDYDAPVKAKHIKQVFVHAFGGKVWQEIGKAGSGINQLFSSQIFRHVTDEIVVEENNTQYEDTNEQNQTI